MFFRLIFMQFHVFCFLFCFVFLFFFLPFFSSFFLCTLVLWTYKPWKKSVDILVFIRFKRLPCKKVFFKFHFNHCYIGYRLSSRIQCHAGKTYSVRYLCVKIFPHSLNITGQTTTKNKRIIIFLLGFICIG